MVNSICLLLGHLTYWSRECLPTQIVSCFGRVGRLHSSTLMMFTQSSLASLMICKSFRWCSRIASLMEGPIGYHFPDFPVYCVICSAQRFRSYSCWLFSP